MPLIPVKTPKVVKSLYPKYIWDITTLEKVLYLTFDDGPTPEITPWTLELLEHYNAKATFFCIGNNIEQYPELFKQTLLKGHAIGNHTQQHLKGWFTPKATYLNDTKKAQQQLDRIYLKHGLTPKKQLFRPPYGKLTRAQGKSLMQLGYNIVMWDILSFDWDASISKERCLKHVISKAERGSIIVFHDSLKASKNMQYALPKVLEYFAKKGYRFEALPF
jgi:peptidoglycan/xylan/chitin deacetylase (PgdA/CDA1 family)